MKFISCVLVTLILLLVGCGSETAKKKTYSANVNSDTNSNQNTATPTPEMGGTLLLDGTGESRTIPCNERTVEVDEESTANSFTLTGECKKIVVDGVSNKIYVDNVGEIEVVGASNSVYYGGGLDGKKPKISKKGTSLIVEKKKEVKSEKEKAK